MKTDLAKFYGGPDMHELAAAARPSLEKERKIDGVSYRRRLNRTPY